ncbi:VOC family protein [Verrucomicrobiota bacterium]
MKNADERFVTGICHFGLSVADLGESIRFYTEVLGLECATRREKDAFFQIGAENVFALIQYPGSRAEFDAEMRPKRWGKSFTHFGLQAPSVEAVFAFQDHLRASGVKIVKEAYERWDGASLYFLDPNGYTIEYIYFAPPEA